MVGTPLSTPFNLVTLASADGATVQALGGPGRIISLRANNSVVDDPVWILFFDQVEEPEETDATTRVGIQIPPGTADVASYLHIADDIAFGTGCWIALSTDSTTLVSGVLDGVQLEARVVN